VTCKKVNKYNCSNIILYWIFAFVVEDGRMVTKIDNHLNTQGKSGKYCEPSEDHWEMYKVVADCMQELMAEKQPEEQSEEESES